jgi:hypothetical protein
MTIELKQKFSNFVCVGDAVTHTTENGDLYTVVLEHDQETTPETAIGSTLERGFIAG